MKSKLLPLVSAIVLSAGCSSAPKVAQENAQPWRVQVNRVNMQKDPSHLAETVALVPFGATLEPSDSKAGWLKVKVEGWVHRSALTQGPLAESREMTLKELEKIVSDSNAASTNAAPAQPVAATPAAAPAPAPAPAQ